MYFTVKVGLKFFHDARYYLSCQCTLVKDCNYKNKVRNKGPKNDKTHLFFFLFNKNLLLKDVRAQMFPASDIFKTGHNTVNDQLLNPLALANGSTEIHALVSRVYISVLWAIDTCQNKVFADLYHVILSQVKVNLEFIED